MNDDIREFMFMFICVLLVLFIAFCGAALCIHVYGIHWAHMEHKHNAERVEVTE